MFRDVKILRRTLIAVSLAILVGNSVMLYSSLKSLVDATEWLRHSVNVKQVLSELVAELAKAESAKRGYILMEDIVDIENYYVASREAKIRIKTLQDLVSDNNEQMINVRKISDIIDGRLLKMSEAIRMQSSGNGEGARNLIRSNRNSSLDKDLSLATSNIEERENSLLSERRDKVDLAEQVSLAALCGFVLAVLLLLGIVYYFASMEIRRKTNSSLEIKKYAEELHRQTEDLTRDRNEIALLNEASSFLQSCNTVSEISAAFPPFMERLFPDYRGSVFLTAASRNRLDFLCAWGIGCAAPYFAPQQCWGLRRGQIHIHTADSAAPLCEHLDGLENSLTTACMPLVAHGETVGLLALWKPDESSDDGDSARFRRLVDMVARQLGLTLANIRLRESLKEQTIRDAMTNAFNRRYLDVVSQKEMAKAKRFSRPMTVAMIDIDHFKRFNDTQGHQAGDTALVRVSQFLQESIRESDWLFRYGGEEFLMILTDTEVQDGWNRLDMLRAAISQMVIRHEGATLPQVTISCGIAGFPAHADDFEGIVSLADEALYRAKQEGRNCTRLALEDVAISQREEPEPV